MRALRGSPLVLPAANLKPGYTYLPHPAADPSGKCSVAVGPSIRISATTRNGFTAAL
jgi:hypothetical protein